jgi:hypothetical protein
MRKGDVEIDVESNDRQYVEMKVKEFEALLPASVTDAKPSTQGVLPTHGGKKRSMAEHVRQLGPKSGTQYVVSIGDYLERLSGMGRGFKTRDIADAFRSVKYKHSNPAEAVRQAKLQGFLMDGDEQGTMQLTQTAESWVKGQLTGDSGD